MEIELVEYMKQTLEQRIKKFLLEHIRPAIQMDGGDVEFVSYDTAKKMVVVELKGACQGCAMSEITLKQGIEQMVKDAFPEVTEVVTR